MVSLRKWSNYVTKEHWDKVCNYFLSTKATIECAGFVLSIRDNRGSNFGLKWGIMTYIFRDFP